MMEDSSRHSQFGTALCESAPHASLCFSLPPRQSIPGWVEAMRRTWFFTRPLGDALTQWLNSCGGWASGLWALLCSQPGWEADA